MIEESKGKNQNANIFLVLRPYVWSVVLLVLLTIISNGLSLYIPRIISQVIDSYSKGVFNLESDLLKFSLIVSLIFIFTLSQNVVQIFTAEKVARKLRQQLVEKISNQSYIYIQSVTSSKLLTNLTSDVDAVKNFVANAVSSVISSIFMILGAGTLLILINWRLALAVLAIMPVISVAFYLVMLRVRSLFKKSQEVIDWLNRVIDESILGSILIRILDSNKYESKKFDKANQESYDLGLKIVKLFASLIPIINFATGMAITTILVMGGHFVVSGSMSLGDFTAFNTYMSALIFPIIVIGFMGDIIAQSGASYQRILEILDAEVRKHDGEKTKEIDGEIIVDHVSLKFGEKFVLKDASFVVAAKSRTAIIGPTAAGKTQLVHILAGLNHPTSGVIKYDNININEYSKDSLYSQMGLVFQDSIIFNLSLRENIAFSKTVTDESLSKAIETAELKDFVDNLPDKLDAVISERGSTLSGGQKQRVMLARALSINPKVLLLDDFTARLDALTEQKILENIKKNYPDLTLVSVTQKIDPIKNYDQIILIMEGEVLMTGTHDELLKISPEYVQIFNSQQSTNQYEL